MELNNVLKRLAALVGCAGPWGEQGKCHANSGALSRRGGQRNSTVELLRHKIIDDVQAEPSTALRASGGKERIKNVTLNIPRNAAAVIRESDFDLFRAKARALISMCPPDPSAKPWVRALKMRLVSTCP